jgi:uncharacterized membrane protein YhfC
MLLYVAFVVQVLFMVLAPLALGRFLVRRGLGTWRLFFTGALAFVASQVVHIPLLIGLTVLAKQPSFPHPPDAWKLVVNAVVLGLAAGACEEPARWIALERFAKNARGYRAALVFGAGHGGVESFLLGVLAAVNIGAMTFMRFFGAARLGVHAEQLDQVNDAVNKFWATPAYMPLVGAGERAMAMTIHLAASTLVMRGVVAGRPRWLALAILFHAVVDGVAVWVVGRYGALPTEALTLGFTALAVAILVLGRPRRPSSGATPAPAERSSVERAAVTP